MAKKDAFCTQCGSLITVDDTKSKETCIFCKAEVDTRRALELNSNSEARLLLQNAALQKAKEESAANKDKQKGAGSGKADYVAAKSIKHEYVLKPLPMKVKLVVTGITLGIVILISAVLVPTIIDRNSHRDSLTANLKNTFEFEVGSMAFSANDNRQFVVSTLETLSEAEVVEAANVYALVYAADYDTTVDKVKDKLTVTIYDKTGRYICSFENSEVVSEFETATPTKAPTPTVAITNP